MMVVSPKKRQRDGKIILAISVLIFVTGTAVCFFTNYLPPFFYEKIVANYSLFLCIVFGLFGISMEKLNKNKLLNLFIILFCLSMLICLLAKGI